MLKDLILKNRSFRRFSQDEKPTEPMLREWIDCARLSASGGNRQPLRYIISVDPKTNARIFPNLAWAGFLKDWPGPAEGERPTVYIVILHDLNARKDVSCDHGIAAQSILLAAAESGFGGCMVGAINKDGLRKALNISDQYEILLVIALGKPSEEVILETVNLGDAIKYYRDKDDNHHVPKIKLDNIILKCYE